MGGLHACQRRRRPRLPAELAGVFGQFAQDDLLAADGGRFEVAAVEELLDGFLDDRTVGVSFPAAVPGELTQHPFLAVVPEPAGVACRDQRVDQVRAASARSRPRPLPCVEDIFDVQGAAAQVLGVEPEVVRGGCLAVA